MDYLTKLFAVPAEKITLDANLNTDLGLDSIDLIDLLSAASERYKVDLDPHDFHGIATVREFLGKFEERLGKNS